MPKIVHSSQFIVHGNAATVNREPITVNRPHWRRAFTLIEILVVLTILGIITSIGTVAYNNTLDKGRDSRRKNDLSAIKSTLTLYFEDNHHYPPECTSPPCTDAEYPSDAGDDWIPDLSPYIKKLPKDSRQTSLNIFSTLASLFGQKGPESTKPQVAATSTITLSDNYDGYVNSSSNYFETGSFLEIGHEAPSTTYRTFMRFDLSALPAGADVTSLELRVNNTSMVGGADFDLQAYNQNGQTDPELDSGADKRIRSGNDTTPYINNNSTTFKSLGIKTITLPSEAMADLEAAKSAVNRFSLAISEDGSSDQRNGLESLESSGTDEPKLVITYTVPPCLSPTFDAVSDEDGSGVSSLSWQHTVGTGPDRALLIGVALRSAQTATGMTVNGNPISMFINSVNVSGGVRVAHGIMVNPPSGVNNITVNFSASTNAVAGSTSWTGVNQTAPTGTSQAAQNSTSTPSVTVSSATNEVVVATVAVNSSGLSYTVGPGQTDRWDNNAGYGAPIGLGSSKPGDTSTTMSWTINPAAGWVMVATPLKPTTCAIPTPTPTPTPTPSATPTSAPTPTPSASPSSSPVPSGDCDNKSVYCYVVPADRKSYTIWAKLENTNDSEINNCAGGPTGFNYCLKSD